MPISRRRFLAGAGALGAALGADAFGLEANRVLISRHNVPVSGLPRSIDGIRLAQVIAWSILAVSLFVSEVIRREETAS